MKKRIVILSVMLLLSSCAQAQENNGGIKETLPTEETTTTETSAAVSEPTIPNTDYEYDITYSGSVNIKKYLGSETAVTIPEEIEGCPVTAYSPYAFEDTGVTELTLPSGLQKFSGIRSAHYLETVNITSDIESLNAGQIIDCEKLKNVNISDSSKYISKDGIVYSADGRTLTYFPMGRSGEFTVPDGVEIIGEDAFYRTSLTSVILSDDVREIVHSAFRHSELEKISFNEGLKSIGVSAFKNTSVREFYLPDSIEQCWEFWDEGSEISAPLSAVENKDMDILLLRDNVKIEYRGETELMKAVRNAEPLWEWRDGRIYIDIDGDNFPERFDVRIDELEDNGIYVYGSLYFYNTDECVWEGLYCYPLLSPFSIYYDREFDEYFFIADTAEVDSGWYDKFIFTDTGLKVEHFGESWGFGYSHDENWYTKGGISFGTLGKYFYFNEEPNEDDTDAFDKTLSDNYEIAAVFDLEQIIRAYGYENSEEQFEIFVEDFADSPQPSEYKKPYKEKEEVYIIIGEKEITLSSTYVHIDGNNTDITEETFEELSKLPYLCGLGLYGDSIDLSGIEKLTGLRLLSLRADNIVNGEKAAELKELTVLGLSPDISDFGFVEYLDSVKVIEFGDTLDKPADFYAPMYKMKGLRYMLESVWERIITDEQRSHIRENAPWIDICTYKVG